MNKKNSNNKLILTIILTLMLITIVIGLSYAIFFFRGEGTKSNTISTRTIKCLFNEGLPINIAAAFPINDEVGKKLSTQIEAQNNQGYQQGFYDANLSCECKGTCKGFYELYLTKTTESSDLEDEYIKVYVTDGNEIEKELKAVTTYNKLDVSTINQQGKIIYKGSFSESFSQKIRLRMWISNDYKVSDKSYTFKAKLNANVSE